MADHDEFRTIAAADVARHAAESHQRAHQFDELIAGEPPSRFKVSVHRHHSGKADPNAESVSYQFGHLLQRAVECKPIQT